MSARNSGNSRLFLSLVAVGLSMNAPTRLQPIVGVLGITICIFVDFRGYLVLAQVESWFCW